MAVESNKAGNELTLSVGPKANWLGLFTAMLVILIIWGVGIGHAFRGLFIAIGSGRSIGGFVLGIAALCALSLFIAYGILLSLFGSEVITISSTELELQSLVCGLNRSKRSVTNSTVENLRYEEWAGPRGAGMQHGIRFDCVGETVTFAQAATTAESYDIIDQMRQVYNFPISNSSETDDSDSSPAVTHW
jgi:hypothetical protein